MLHRWMWVKNQFLASDAALEMMIAPLFYWTDETNVLSQPLSIEILRVIRECQGDSISLSFTLKSLIGDKETNFGNETRSR